MHTRPAIASLLAAATLAPTSVQAQPQPQILPQTQPLPQTQAQTRAQQALPDRSARQDQSGEISAGVDYQQGDYGTRAKVETISTSLAVAIRKGRMRLGAALPYLRTTAPADVVVSQGGLFGTPLLASGGAQSVRTRRQGIGDATLQVAYDMPIGRFATSLAGGVKLPTASRAKGLGTGKADYAVTAQIARSLKATITPFAALGYTIVGKPDDFSVRNTVSGTAGTRVTLSPRAFAALSYSYEQSVVQTLSDRQSLGLGLGVNWGAAAGRKVQLSVQSEAGLSQGAPDMKVGLRIGAGF